MNKTTVICLDVNEAHMIDVALGLVRTAGTKQEDRKCNLRRKMYEAKQRTKPESK